MNAESVMVTRIYRFSASHRLDSPHLSVSENQQLYGKCNNPFGHGHDYVLEVSATGEVDTRTGLVLPSAQLDRLVEERVLKLFAFRNINLDVPQFASCVPTTENIARVIGELLQQHWNTYLGETQARLYRVHVRETGRNGFEILLGKRPNTSNHESGIVSIHA